MTGAMMIIVESSSTPTMTICKRARVVCWVPVVTVDGDVQTNMLGVLDRSAHLGVIVGIREFFFLTSVDDIASDEKLQMVSCGSRAWHR